MLCLFLVLFPKFHSMIFLRKSLFLKAKQTCLHFLKKKFTLLLNLKNVNAKGNLVAGRGLSNLHRWRSLETLLSKAVLVTLHSSLQWSVLMSPLFHWRLLVVVTEHYLAASILTPHMGAMSALVGCSGEVAMDSPAVLLELGQCSPSARRESDSNHQGWHQPSVGTALVHSTLLWAVCLLLVERILRCLWPRFPFACVAFFPQECCSFSG